MHEGALGVHEIELVVQPGPGLSDGRGVGQHAHGTGHLHAIGEGREVGQFKDSDHSSMVASVQNRVLNPLSHIRH